MLSTIVLVPDGAGPLNRRLPELVARSLGWLVSAAVAGLVRDVVIACPIGLDLGDLADQAGCGLARGASEVARLRQASLAIRGDRILLLRTGWLADRSLVEDLDATLDRLPHDKGIRILAEPSSMLQRLVPALSPAVGLVLPRSAFEPGRISSFAGLSRTYARAVRLPTRMRPIARDH